MPLVCADITIPANTPRENPVRIQFKVPAGVIRKVWVLISYGHNPSLNVSWYAED